MALTSGILLSGCAYDMYGNDYGYGYGPYGYGYPRSGVSIGIGYGSGYGGYYGGYGGYAYPYGGYGGYDPFGWYGSYYYPGSGIYVYDQYRTRHVWNGDQQRYWTQRRQQWQNRTGTRSSTGDNWSGWDRHRRDRGGATTSSTWTRGSGTWTRSSTSSSDGSQQVRGNRGHRHGDRDD